METAPKRVRERFEALKRASPFPTVLKMIKGRYYVYRHTTQWDKEQKKVRSVGEYLGRLLEDGTFVKKAAEYKDAVEQAKEVIEAVGGKVTLPEVAPFERRPEHDKLDRDLLTTLSMNSRADLSFAAKRLGVQPNTVYGRVKRLEKKFGLNYTLELSLSKLKHFTFLLLVKFIDGTPTAEEMKMALLKEPKVQFAATASGPYDLVLYVLAEDDRDIADTEVKIMSAFPGRHNSKKYITNFHGQFGFIPLRHEFIETLKGKILDREYTVIKELNVNSKDDFTEIDRKYGYDQGRSNYTYGKLRESGIIIRSTISMTLMPVKYVGVMAVEVKNEQTFLENRNSFLEDIIGDTDYTVNKYALAGETGNPVGVLLFMPVFKEGELERSKDKLLSLDIGADIQAFVLTNTLVGRLCYRLFDCSYSMQYEALVKAKAVAQRQRTNYESTGRRKKRPKTAEFILPSKN